jgi:putative redox protein
MHSTKVHFDNPNGERLAARLDRPVDEAPDAYALFAHCFTCSKDLRAAKAISRALTGQNIAVLRFDFTGLGESEGEFADTNFTSNVDDLVAAASYLEAEHEAPQILVGHSLGGAAVLQAAGRIEASRAVATIGAPSTPEHVTHLLEDAREEIERTGQARVTLAGRTFTIKRQFLDDLETAAMEETIGSLDRPLMIFHSPIDQIVGVDNAAGIFEAARHPKSFVSLDDADHLLTDPADAAFVGNVLGSWARTYVEPASDAAGASEADPDDVVTRTEGGGFRTEVRARGHALVADEPAGVGGGDEGPTPYELLTAALGTCTGMTLQLYAGRKEWPLDEAVVRLTHDKVHADDCEHCDENGGQVDRIVRDIELVGDLDDRQRERLLEIANKCPVHRTLTGDIRVVSQLHRSAEAAS